MGFYEEINLKLLLNEFIEKDNKIIVELFVRFKKTKWPLSTMSATDYLFEEQSNNKSIDLFSRKEISWNSIRSIFLFF